MVKAKVVSKDVGARENGAKTWIVWKYALHVQGLNHEEGVYEL
jgi:hypothetical protein